MSRSRGARTARRLAWVALLATLLAINGPVVVAAVRRVIHNYEINTASYKAKMGHWSVLDVSTRFRIDAVHAALLYTGKVLIVAGSGNNQGNFNAGRFESLIWNPATNTFKLIHTPSDMFCGGHAFLPDGKLLIAGGTTRYEVLADNVKYAAGVMFVKDESPNGRAFTLPAGTRFRSSGGSVYVSTVAVKVKPASKVIGPRGKATVTASSVETWVRAVERGKGSILSGVQHFTVLGHPALASRNFYGVSLALNMNKQDFWGSDESYIFDPASERYERVSNLNLARWYPSLVGLSDGQVLAVSGLNQFGQMINGQTEIYTPSTRRWTLTPRLTRVFPTYPSLFLMPNGNLFYSGSNAGYGSSTVGRTPGIWNLSNNSFTVVPGLKDPAETETSMSVLLPPAQAQRYLLVGGGGVGNSLHSTARTAVVNLKAKHPHWVAGPSLPEPTRYPSVVITPDNTVVITGGSRYYRGEFNSDILTCHLYDPATNKLDALASPAVGRDYHSEALLLPDGRIVTLGGNPLYGNATDSSPGYFQRKIEIYSPPYLYHGARPKITGGPSQVTRGGIARFQTPDANAIAGARMLLPSAVTHATDSTQRSIELSVVRSSGSIAVSIPSSAGLVPTDWYMMFVTNEQGTPSEARWVHVA